MAEAWAHGRKPEAALCQACGTTFYTFEPDASLCPRCRDELRCELGEPKRCTVFCQAPIPLGRLVSR